VLAGIKGEVKSPGVSNFSGGLNLEAELFSPDPERKVNPTKRAGSDTENELRKTDDNLLRFHGDAASTAVEDAAVNYQSPSIIAAGADAHGVSIFTTLINLSLALVCFKAPTLIEKAGLAKRGAIILAFLNLLAWVPLTLAFILSRLGITSGWFALLWFVNVVPGMLLSFQRDNWLSNLIPRGTLGRYLGQRLAIKSAFYLGAFFTLGYILDKLGKDNLAGFAVIFTIAIAVGLIDFIIFTFMGEKKGQAPVSLPKTETGTFGLHEYFGELKEKKLDTFILFTTFFYLTVGLSGPLYAVFMLNELHFSYLTYTLVISAEYLARVVSAPFWGRYADKAGNIKVLGIVSRIIPIVPISWLFCHNLGYLVVIQILSGTCWGAFDLGTQSYLYKVAPPQKKLRYIVYTRCLILLCTAMGGLLGAFCVNSIFPTFGSRILSIFWLSGISRAVVALYMMPRLVDLAVSFGKQPSPPVADQETLRRVLASKRGQFYHRERQAGQAVAQIQSMSSTVASDINLYSGRRRWAPPEKPEHVKQQPAVAAKPEKISLRLDHYRQALAALSEMKSEIAHHGIESNIGGLKARFNAAQQPEPAVAGAVNSAGLAHHEMDMERLLARFNGHRPEAAAVSAGNNETPAHHEVNMERLKARFNTDRQPELVAASTVRQGALQHHEVNVERLKARFDADRQPVAVAAHTKMKLFTQHQQLKKEEDKVKSNNGLFQNKVGWARYMKDTLDAALRDMRGGQQVPVTVNSRSEDWRPWRDSNPRPTA